jgi:hypothetical protein
MKFNKKLMILCTVVIVILLAMMLFRREGYDLTPKESEKLDSILKDSKITVEDRNKLMKYILTMSKDKPFGQNPNDLQEFFNKYKSDKALTQELRSFLKSIADRLATGSSGGDITSRLPRSFGCNITPDNTFNCRFDG